MKKADLKIILNSFLKKRSRNPNKAMLSPFARKNLEKEWGNNPERHAKHGILLTHNQEG